MCRYRAEETGDGTDHSPTPYRIRPQTLESRVTIAGIICRESQGSGRVWGSGGSDGRRRHDAMKMRCDIIVRTLSL